ncbi:MAG: serine/threonine-protein kinase [Myxococcota bacterium]|jgi:serine/threonine-protein kinase|nr:serine/threonine-protein kinase [Myxococcota bacterium]
MEAILILLVIFGSITAWVLGPRWLHLRHEERLRALQAKSEPKALTAERDELLERVRHLEAVVCSVDFELNAKLNRISTQQLALPLPAQANDDKARAALPQRSLAEGERIGARFVIRKAIGQGGMGAVYEAFDETLKETVALKLVRDAQWAAPDVIARFRREVSLARRIQHPNVLRIHDLGEDGGLLFLSMQRVEGSSLRELIQRQGKLGERWVCELLDGVLSALEACHEQGVLHRDIKPDNILVNSDNIPILIDFGLARLDLVGSMTATQAILGTPEYMAPEQIRGEALDVRTDLYAVGIMTFELLTGRPPFSASTPIATGFAHCTQTPPALELEGPRREAWQSFLSRALEKEPARRFGSAHEMRQALPRD